MRRRAGYRGRRRAIGRFEDIVALVLEQYAQRRANLFVVVDDQDAVPNTRRVTKLLHSLLHETSLDSCYVLPTAFAMARRIGSSEGRALRKNGAADALSLS